MEELNKNLAVDLNNRNKKNKKPVRFNALDVILIILVLIIITMSVLIFVPKIRGSLTRGESTKILYTIEISGVAENVAANIRVGDTVVDISTGYIIGKVAGNPEADDYKEFAYIEGSKPEEGRVVMAVVPEKKNILITIEADAYFEKDKGYTVNNYRIAVEKEMIVRFPNYEGTVRCLSVKPAS